MNYPLCFVLLVHCDMRHYLLMGRVKKVASSWPQNSASDETSYIADSWRSSPTYKLLDLACQNIGIYNCLYNDFFTNGTMAKVWDIVDMKQIVISNVTGLLNNYNFWQKRAVAWFQGSSTSPLCCELNACQFCIEALTLECLKLVKFPCSSLLCLQWLVSMFQGHAAFVYFVLETNGFFKSCIYMYIRLFFESSLLHVVNRSWSLCLALIGPLSNFLFFSQICEFDNYHIVHFIIVAGKDVYKYDQILHKSRKAHWALLLLSRLQALRTFLEKICGIHACRCMNKMVMSHSQDSRPFP